MAEQMNAGKRAKRSGDAFFEEGEAFAPPRVTFAQLAKKLTMTLPCPVRTPAWLTGLAPPL